MVSNLTFEWDDSNSRHIAEHLVSPQEAEEVLLNEPADIERQNRNGEERLLQLGETREGRILIVVSTFTGSKIRVITAWPAKERLRRYWRSLQAGAGGEG